VKIPLNKHSNPAKAYDEIRAILLVFAIVVLSGTLNGINGQATISETADTVSETKVEEAHSIKKATIYSAVLPGLGQAYNRKYWKIPIVYVGFGVLTYFIVTNTQEYKKFREAYVYVANDETYPIDNEYVDLYNQDQLQTGMDDYRKYRDISWIITALWYGLNVLDANVDAHFYDFEISDDLSLEWEPYVTPALNQWAGNNQTETGLKITLNF
jgi:hypothetical protein